MGTTTALRRTLAEHGAVYDDDGAIVHFGDPGAELKAAFDSCALFERSETVRLLGTGADLLGLLHRLSTGAVSDLAAGAGKPTVLTTPKGRIIDLVFVHHLGDKGVLLAGGAGGGERVAAHLDRYTFAEQTGLREIMSESYLFSMIGPAAALAVRSCGAKPPAPHHVTEARIAGNEAHVLGQNGFDAGGFSISGPLGAGADVWSTLAHAVREAGGRPAGQAALESFRVLRGLPAAGHELTEEHNPLEAGLLDAVSFDKGCYVGQEVVARLRTYDKVSRALVGLKLEREAPVPSSGTALVLEGRTVGVLTSAVVPPGSDSAVALGYIKRKELRPDLVLQVGEDGPSARLVDLPFRRS